ncbi:uncharacterized protein [Miscanthus floridulus]|uniref:uncharacterized protein n=1 Tax=Miscanthus floridulus TaxID=154761 RepID=UPI0034591A39
MDISQYTGRLKQLADALRDVDQPVHETSQVLNMLRGLSSKYRHAIPVITSKQRPHTFLSAHSYLLLEEQYDKEHAKAAAHHALLTTGGARPPASSSGDGGSGSSSSANPPVPKSTAVGHAVGLNPWTGMVQAWQMPFRVPGAGVLGPRPGASPHQAYLAGPPLPAAYTPSPSTPDVWNHQALLTALATANVPPSGPQTAEWYLDTGASSHMASNAVCPAASTISRQLFLSTVV